MSKDLSKLLETQISLTEWLAKIGHSETDTMREEDNTKRERLGEISQIINLPYDKPTTFEASEVAKRAPMFKKFLAEHGDELCALRLLPKPGTSAEKLRNRGQSVRNVMRWFDKLDIDPNLYKADFVPHIEDYSWATIFIVGEDAIFGEIYKGGHHILTQGFYDGEPPIIFQYDFKKWTLTPHNTDALKYLKKLISYIHVADPTKQKQLAKKVQAEFSHGYIKGYFESTHSDSRGTWFIDYNRLLGKSYEDFKYTNQSSSSQAILKGNVACGGKAAGRVHLVSDPASEDIKPGEILVCTMTSPDYIPLMVRAKGLITDHGGILCHAAIVARELGLPCIVGTGSATKILKTGDKVEMDLTTGEVRR